MTSLWLILLLVPLHAEKHHRSSVEEEDFVRCHMAVRDTPHMCNEYANYDQHSREKRQVEEGGEVPVDEFADLELEEGCMEMKWAEVGPDNNWGHCLETKQDDSFRYIHTNTVPDFYYNPYCPLGLGQGYCTPEEKARNKCYIPEEIVLCGGDNGEGSTPYGDVWVPSEAWYKIPLEGNPTRSDLPRDMYDAEGVGAVKSDGAVLGVATNGIGIRGSATFGGISIDEAKFQLICGGHVTPPLTKVNMSTLPAGAPPGTTPIYHFHKAPDCLEAFQLDNKEIYRGGTPNKHGRLIGWGLDGFGIYTFQDIGGTAPVVDECGGHFGPVSDESDEVVYHYHARPHVPYTLACQGPALGKCDETQTNTTNFCHFGCGAEVCVQPGTKEGALRKYLANWNETWLDSFKSNRFSVVASAYSSAALRVEFLQCFLMVIAIKMVAHFM